MTGISRRSAGLGMAAIAISSLYDGGRAQVESITLPFGNGERLLVRYPQKRPLIRLTSRPPQLETPFSVFAEGPITPNDAFFVRYHLASLPYDVDPEKFILKVKGKVDRVARGFAPDASDRNHRWIADEVIE
jgi:sulfite dehydrogenase (cytochrome) subunit A